MPRRSDTYMTDFTPHAYQLRTIEMVETGRSYLLGLDMGLGKTVTTLTGVQTLIRNRQACNVLVVCPKLVVGTWVNEIEKWSHLALGYSVVTGSQRQRLDALRVEADVYIINIDNLVWLIELLGKDPSRWPFDTVIIDESSKFKSAKTKRFKALRRVRPYTERFLLLTGTPAPQGYQGLWSQVYLLDGGDRLGRSFHWFQQRYYYKTFPQSYEYKLRPGAGERILESISDICITLCAEDYLTLPDLHMIPIEIELPMRARDVYRELELTMVAELSALETVDAANAAVLTGKLLQVSNGALYHEDGQSWTELHGAKLDVLESIVEEANGAPVLVFYQYKHDFERLCKRFRSAVSVKEPGAVERWNKGEVPLLLAHPASAGYGINLQEGGSIMVWFGLNWSLELYQQANARLHRQGQAKPVFCYQILARDTMDHEVLDRLANKREVQDVLKQYLKRKAA